MNVISILALAEGQTIPRPFSRASTPGELVELLRPYVNAPVVANIDTEEPLGSGLRFGKRVKFYAFTER